MELKESNIAHKVLGAIPMIRGMMWEKIKRFQDKMNEIEGALNHTAGNPQSDEMKKACPLKQNIEGGLYTREIFVTKGSIIVSMIHKQDHPSFLLKGKVSYVTDEGEIKTISAPKTVFTKTGTQRVFYVHEDTQWCCVNKTEAKTFEEAEADVYTNDYNELPKELIHKNKLLWQQ
tara:strand:+ start:813 stop:1337 length:525 start_codon:yes stop_codon:yes gene_type:complete